MSSSYLQSTGCNDPDSCNDRWLTERHLIHGLNVCMFSGEPFCRERDSRGRNIPHPQADSRVKLDVGGNPFETTVQTLTSGPKSMLETMFSGRFSVVREEDATILLDRCGLMQDNASGTTHPRGKLASCVGCTSKPNLFVLSSSFFFAVKPCATFLL